MKAVACYEAEDGSLHRVADEARIRDIVLLAEGCLGHALAQVVGRENLRDVIRALIAAEVIPPRPTDTAGGK